MKEQEKDTIQKIIDDVKKDEPRKERNPIFFIIGAVLLIIGVFILSRKIIVTNSFATFSILGHDFTSGLLLFPLIFGIIWLFYDTKSIGAKILTAIGILLVIVSVIMSIHIHLTMMTLFDYIIIIGMIAAGIGFLLRYYFKKA